MIDSSYLSDCGRGTNDRRASAVPQETYDWRAPAAGVACTNAGPCDRAVSLRATTERMRGRAHRAAERARTATRGAAAGAVHGCAARGLLELRDRAQRGAERLSPAPEVGPRIRLLEAPRHRGEVERRRVEDRLHLSPRQRR